MRVSIGWLVAVWLVACGCDRMDRPPPEADRWLTVAAADRQACGVTRDGTAWCWGGTTTDPVPVQGAPPLVSITVGARSCLRAELSHCREPGTGHVCGLDGRGFAWCWGRNDHGQLGDGTTRDRTRPALVTGSIRYRSIRAGNAFTCAVSVDSLAYCWGYNGHGNLGMGITDTLPHPMPKAVARGVSLIATGADHACGLDADGSAFCWGDDFRARLGSDAAMANGGSSAPVPVNGVHRFQAVSAGIAHACGLTPAGLVFCWGSNADGELGSAPLSSFRRDPTAVITPPLVALSDGVAAHTCGLTSNGRAWCWGNDSHGQLGSGEAAPCRATPGEQATTTGAACAAAWSAVKSRARFRSLTTGRDFTCGVTLDDALLCWGRLPSAPDLTRESPRPVAIRVSHARGGRPGPPPLHLHHRDSVAAPGNPQ
jgi:alpha-tubulin suppressor-like RCC1 family protein